MKNKFFKPIQSVFKDSNQEPVAQTIQSDFKQTKQEPIVKKQTMPAAVSK